MSTDSFLDFSLIQVTGWTQYNHPTAQRSFPHLRSHSSSNNVVKSGAKAPRPVSKSISTGALQTMAAVSRSPGIPSSRILSPFCDDDGNISTLPDPRSRTMSPANENGPPSPSQHPDLNSEVATLSNKLINAINHQTNLDDTLSATRHELETSRERVKKLELENQEHVELVQRGLLIRKGIADAEKNKLLATVTEERRQRMEAEKEKKRIEQELESLTTALFEEANKMVITAREEAQKEHDVIQRRNDQLKAQLKDTEGLLKSHQEQLAELKQVMEQMTEEHDEQQTNPTAPSTPGLSKFDSKDDMYHDADTVQSSMPEAVSPSYPTSFTHLLQPVLRTDLSAYEDFTSLLQMSKNIAGSRASSGSYGATIGLGLGLGAYSGSITQQTNGSTSSLSTAATLGSSPATPTTPASTISTGSANGPNSLTPLKETKFYKRALAEDIEPTLRLDTAPGLSWLARRTVLNAVCEGSLVVEPMPVSTKPFVFACSLCGETRKDAAHIRSHRFRTSENDNAQKYPLCRYCHGRVRSTCDLLGFLRILKDGHWRANDEESEKAAWEESVRLREQMFWCRMGGGVIPTHPLHHTEHLHSPRVSGDSRTVQEKELNDEVERTGEIQPRDVTPVIEQRPISSVTTATQHASRLSTQNENSEGVWETALEDAAAPIPSIEPPSIEAEPESVEEKADIADAEVPAEKTDTVRDSIQSTASLEVASEDNKEGAQRLSITIPGSFEGDA
ncbi:Rab guanine nucleotide exchange factor sec2 [Lachnellula suecica]|uniref:Rab guanine nucleotide exchange factor sec2 n=1 Tax=Lachnellula suecica TaxID=602035 RepID=A0A8T9BY92_9HELO|nr:Rab guanine nucleotide exchange factor sec2 [Lachnellula suecica]